MVCCRFYLTATPFAANPSGAVRATGVMFNQRERQIQKSPGGLLTTDLFFEDLLGFNLSVFPGVFLLSRWRLSGSPVESAIRFGPGLRPIIVILSIVKRKALKLDILTALRIIKRG